MPNYQLNADISAADLATIHAAGEKIVLLKLSGATPVAWVSFEPFESNTVQWTESYALYGSYDEVSSGTVISMMSQIAAAPEQNYNFMADGAFSAPTPANIGDDTYQVTNQYNGQPSLTFGLAQGVQANGSAFPFNPINAQAVPANQLVTFSPLTEVVIFLVNNITSGMVITTVSSLSTTLTFGDGVENITVQYEAASGTFVQTSAKKSAKKQHAVS